MKRYEPDEHTFPAKKLEHIFDAAIRQILQRGAEHLSLPDVAAECEVSTAEMQEVFPSKRIFFHAILHWYYVKFGRQMRSIINMHADPFYALENALYEFAELCLDRRKVGISLLRSTVMDFCFLDNELRTEFMRYNEIWTELVREKLHQSETYLGSPEDIERLVCYFRMVFSGIYELAKFNVPEDDILASIEIALEPLKTRLAPGMR